MDRPLNLDLATRETPPHRLGSLDGPRISRTATLSVRRGFRGKPRHVNEIVGHSACLPSRLPHAFPR